MEKYFIVSEASKDKLLSINKEIPNEFPRVIVSNLNRQTEDTWSFIISGPNDEVTRFIDRLADEGLVL
jgi:hypothetical protein